MQGKHGEFLQASQLRKPGIRDFVGHQVKLGEIFEAGQFLHPRIRHAHGDGQVEPGKVFQVRQFLQPHIRYAKPIQEEYGDVLESFQVFH